MGSPSIVQSNKALRYGSLALRVSSESLLGRCLINFSCISYYQPNHTELTVDKLLEHENPSIDGL